MPMNEFLVQVQPAYLPEQSAPAAGVYVFSYTITVTNTGEVPAQLIARHWIITNEPGPCRRGQRPGRGGPAAVAAAW